jgi:type IV fimbrial biogenesis protein FimT
MLVSTERGQGHAGYTVIELLVTVAVLAIAMMVAVPSFIDFQRRAALSTATSNLAATLNNARSEAMARGTRTVVQPAGTGWASGTVSFVDLDGSRNPSAQNITLATQEAFPNFVTIAGPAEFQFEPSGFAPSNWGTLTLQRSDVTATELAQRTRRIDVARTGRIKVCTPSSDSDPLCPAPVANDPN